MKITRELLSSPVVLMLFALVGVGIVAYTFSITAPVIAESERKVLLAQFHELLADDSYDNDLLEDAIQISDAALSANGKAVTIYRAFRGNTPVALFATPIASGYAGSIKLLVAVRADGTLIGVRTLASQETPGLGDGIELTRSDWILDFNNRSLADPVLDDWQLKKFGGDFDQLTGATITSDAVVSTVREFLIYFEHNQQDLFSTKNNH